MPHGKTSSLKYIYIILAVAVVVAGIVWYQKSNQKDESAQANTAPIISLEQFVKDTLNGENYIVIDLRAGTDFANGHIPDAQSLPHYELGLFSKQLAGLKSLSVLLVCENDKCDYLSDVFDKLHGLQIENVSGLEGGFAAYAAAGLAVVSEDKLIQEDLAKLLKNIKVPGISIDEFIKTSASDRGQIIDTRTSFEFIAGFIPGSINIPLHSIEQAIAADIIDKSKPIYLYDRAGNRSMIAAQALIQKGYKNVHNLEGGVEAWKNSGQSLDIPTGDGSDFNTLMPLLSSAALQQ